MEFAARHPATQRGIDAWLVTAIENMQLLEVSEHCERILAIPTVANRLEVIVCVFQLHAGLLCFDKEAHVAEVRCQRKRVVRSLARTRLILTPFNLYLLLVRILLDLVINIPSKRLPKLIDEILARFCFLIVW